jgi:cell division protein FtsI (penicillin-binding protein 3)
MRRPLKRNRLRLGCVKIVFLLIFLTVGGRAFQLQVFQGDWLMRQGQRQHLKRMDRLAQTRCFIRSRQRTVGAEFGIAVRVYQTAPLAESAEAKLTLARILHLKPAEVERKLQAEKPFVWLKRQISPVEAEQIQALRLNGIGMYFEPTRYYPQGGLAGHLLGFVNRDSEGLEGLELQYNEYIRGAAGSSISERDALGRRVLVEGVEGLQVPPGSDVHLTIDSPIQHLAEKELEAAIQKHRAKAGVAVVVDPATGEVLALANFPTFDPNKASQQSADQRRNRAVTDSFEPGSTFKTILAAAALEEGVVGKDDLFYCEMGKYLYAGRVIHDTHPQGWLPFSKILQVSSNIGFTKVAEKLKKDPYFKYIDRFGFGRVTGLDVPGEVPGLLRKPETWSGIDLATHAFGQGMSATPMQMVMAYAAIANGGILMRPYVTRKIVSPEGQTLLVNQPQIVRRVVSEKTAKLLASMLREVTNEGGTGVAAKVDGFDVAGKTGTAQKAEHGVYSAKKRVSSFVGFVPADNPRLVSLVLIDEPEGNVYGGVVAAPAFRNIAQGALRQLAVAPRDARQSPACPFQLRRRRSARSSGPLCS